uniref:Uncharacterized protein n=1 Tax=Oryza sativa subsp. japonica TaxID=39947 RepID=Q69R47_ORYSJ|nr:hypothetical protein [Oryza sativa Japonica Group]
MEIRKEGGGGQWRMAWAERAARTAARWREGGRRSMADEEAWLSSTECEAESGEDEHGKGVAYEIGAAASGGSETAGSRGSHRGCLRGRAVAERRDDDGLKWGGGEDAVSATRWGRTAMGDAVEEVGDGGTGVDGVVGERRRWRRWGRRRGGGATRWGSDGNGGAVSATRWGRTGMGDGGGCDGCGRGGGCDGCGRYPPMREDEPRSWPPRHLDGGTWYTVSTLDLRPPVHATGGELVSWEFDLHLYKSTSHSNGWITKRLCLKEFVRDKAIPLPKSVDRLYHETGKRPSPSAARPAPSRL